MRCLEQINSKIVQIVSSPDQEDPFFPYLSEKVGDIHIEGKSVQFPNFMDSDTCSNNENEN